MSTIRAKFRCMSVTRKWDGHEIVEFKPVNRDPTKDPENEKFWDATPSGEAQLAYKGDSGFKPGAYYFIDMEPKEEGLWRLSYVTRHGGGSGEVHLGRSWTDREEGLFSGHLKMSISFSETVDLFGTPDGVWAVAFSFAEGPDN